MASLDQLVQRVVRVAAADRLLGELVLQRPVVLAGAGHVQVVARPDRQHLRAVAARTWRPRGCPNSSGVRCCSRPVRPLVMAVPVARVRPAVSRAWSASTAGWSVGQLLDVVRAPGR